MFGFSIISLLTIANAIFANPIPENSVSNARTLNTDLLASNNIESPTDPPPTSPNVPFRAGSTAVTELPQSSVIDCDSDAFVDDFTKNSDNNIQKRFRETSCPVPGGPATQPTPPTDESPKSTTSSGKICSDSDLSHHVTCGGPEIIMLRIPRGLIGSVLNCVHAVATEIAPRGSFPKIHRVADYCCNDIDFEPPLWAGIVCFKLTTNIDIPQMTEQQVRQEMIKLERERKNRQDQKV